MFVGCRERQRTERVELLGIHRSEDTGSAKTPNQWHNSRGPGPRIVIDSRSFRVFAAAVEALDVAGVVAVIDVIAEFGAAAVALATLDSLDAESLVD